MGHDGGHSQDDWHEDLGRPGWGGGQGGKHHEEEPLRTTLANLALQTGLWAAGCLVIASTAPAVLVAPLLRELLVMAAFMVSMAGLLRGEQLSFARFNRQDVAIALIALSLIAALFVDHAAVQAFVQQAQAHAHGAAAAAVAAPPTKAG